jgi:hypothetical protein
LTYEQPEEPTTSNALQLTVRQWAGIAVFAAAVYLLVPAAWQRAEKLESGPEYRLPYELANDYWLWSRVAAQAVTDHDTVILGDSVVWGEYVRPAETISHYLNALEGKTSYANLGVNGTHPTALAGLIEHHGKAISGKRVILQCNPLWMSSPKHDLREQEEFQFLHPKLVPSSGRRSPATARRRRSGSATSWNGTCRSTGGRRTSRPRTTEARPFPSGPWSTRTRIRSSRSR